MVALDALMEFNLLNGRLCVILDLTDANALLADLQMPGMIYRHVRHQNLQVLPPQEVQGLIDRGQVPEEPVLSALVWAAANAGRERSKGMAMASKPVACTQEKHKIQFLYIHKQTEPEARYHLTNDKCHGDCCL